MTRSLTATVKRRNPVLTFMLTCLAATGAWLPPALSAEPEYLLRQREQQVSASIKTAEQFRREAVAADREAQDARSRPVPAARPPGRSTQSVPQPGSCGGIVILGECGETAGEARGR